MIYCPLHISEASTDMIPARAQNFQPIAINPNVGTRNQFHTKNTNNPKKHA